MSTLKTTNIAHPSATGTNIVLNSDDSTTLGTAKLTTLADSAGSNTSTPAEIASGRAKAWVNFDGSGTVAIRASYNVSSITDNGTGDYTVIFTTALADANYSVAFGAGYTQGNIAANSMNCACVKEGASLATGSFRITINFVNGGVSDAATVCATVFR